MSKKILVVDDEPELLEIFSFELEDQGFKVISARSGNDALAIIKNDGGIDFIISDVRMRNGSGLELLEKVIELDLKIPVLLISGFADISEQEVISRGAVAILTKPINFKEIVNYIKLNIKGK